MVVWFDAWCVDPGADAAEQLEAGLSDSAACAVFCGAKGRGPWQQPEVQAAKRKQIKIPEFRVIPILLPGGVRRDDGQVDFLDNNAWIDLRAGLDDREGLYYLECAILNQARDPDVLKQIRKTPNPVQAVELGDVSLPTAPLEVKHPYYVKRETDGDVLRHVLTPRGVVNVHGPKHAGKSSAILQIYAERDLGTIRVVQIKFESMHVRCLKDISVLWKDVLDEAADQLGLADWTASSWSVDRTYRSNVMAFFKGHVFARDQTPLVVCFDEIDRPFDREVKTDFLSSVRHFHARSANDPVLKLVRWLLAFSSEPLFFLGEVDPAPLDVGRTVKMETLTVEEVRELAAVYGLEQDPELLREIMLYVGGRPRLVQEILYNLRRHPERGRSLFDAVEEGEKIFHDYLNPYRLHLAKEEALKQAMKTIVNSGQCTDALLLSRLEAAGLVRRADRQVVPVGRLFSESLVGGV
jgi:hypothetical protein